MYCIHCGTSIPDEASFCGNCGAAIENRPTNTQEASQIQSLGSSLAYTSMICGICSIIFFVGMSLALGVIIGAMLGLALGILGIIFGIVTNFNKSTIKLAIAGVICGSIAVIASIVGLIYSWNDFSLWELF